MIEAVIDIRENIEQGRYPSEAAVSRGIVMRLLNELSWPIFDQTIVAAEFNLRGTRVDYALCHPPMKPLVLLEVKQIGVDTDAAQQLFGYAVHHGVPLAVLTTGREWQFFLPGQRGDYEERRVYMLDLLERDPEECVSRLRRYLDYERVRSGEALEAATADYRDVARDREIKRTLPEAWTKLIEDQDEFLLELVAEKVESLCGYKPSLETVAGFLSGERRPMPPRMAESNRSAASTPQTRNVAQADSQAVRAKKSKVLVFQGEIYDANYGRDLLIKTLQLMEARDPTFLNRFAEKMSSNKERRYIARSKQELFPSSPHLASTASYSSELIPGSGWWIDHNLSLRSVEKVIQKACEVADLEYGVDVKVDF